MSKSKHKHDPFFDDEPIPFSSSKSGSHGHAPSGKCTYSHPPYEVAPGLFLYGGSCIQPVHGDADVYIGLDMGMKRTTRRFPWTEGDEVLFPITDRQPPDNAEQFEQLVDWAIQKLKEGKKVHAGCIGGHGRTGILFAAIRARLVPEDKGAIQHVRKNYCEKAVESKAQVSWLMQHYGVSEAPGSKPEFKGGTTSSFSFGSSSSSAPSKYNGGGHGMNKKTTGKPNNAAASIWG